jgi:two-component system, OmpR family, sensor histidine kinase VicK
MSIVPKELDRNNDALHVVYGEENVLSLGIYCISSTQDKIDLYCDKNAVGSMLHYPKILKLYKETIDRGAGIRVITEITKENLPYVREGLQYVSEVRHMDTITHYFGVSEKHYLSAKLQYDDPRLTQTIFSNIRWFVREHQYLFETLWKKAIPLKQRVKEIEEGRKREFVDTIRDPREIVGLLPTLISSAYEEIKLLFPSSEWIRDFESGVGIAESIARHLQMNRHVRVRLLLREEGEENTRRDYKGHHPDFDSNHKYLLSEEKNVEVRFSDKGELDPRIALIITDDEKMLTVELEDDQPTKSLDSMKFASYSNVESTLMSYSTIFERIWMQSEMKK